jgi:hypothetical protein
MSRSPSKAIHNCGPCPATFASQLCQSDKISGKGRHHMVVRLTKVLLFVLVAAGIAAPQAEARLGSAVSLKLSASQADLGQKLSFSGRVRPNRTGERVLLEQFSRPHWRTVGRGRLPHP